MHHGPNQVFATGMFNINYIFCSGATSAGTEFIMMTKYGRTISGAMIGSSAGWTKGLLISPIVQIN